MHKRNIALISAAFTAVSVGTMLVVACTGDDGFLVPDASVDGTVPVDGNSPDTFVPPADGGTDARDGATADAADAADAQGDSHVVTPDGSTILSHAQQEIEALCTYTKGCCAGAGVAAFDMAKCTALYKDFGFQGDLVGVKDDVLRAGNVLVDTARGAQCYNAIKTLTCKNITAAAYSGAREHCFETLRGTLAANANCRATIECQAGLFCEPFSDGGTFPSDGGTGDAGVAPIIGRCVAVRAVGATCAANEECSYRGDGNGCSATTSQCTGPLANGADCTASGQCTSEICTGTCVTQIADYISAGDCAAFAP